MASQSRVEHQLYLASNSPRRKELLSLFGLAFTTLPTRVDETPLSNEDGVEYVKRIANSKAIAASTHLGANGIVIAADTAVVNPHNPEASEILGKPVDRNEAVRMLRKLRGHTHQVFTALAIRPAGSEIILSDLCATDVPMRNYSDDEIEAYVASGDPMDKAGAYAIQHAGFHPVDKLDGCFANVMGLPLCHLARSLVSLAITPSQNIPQACQAALGHDCPVYHLILKYKIPDRIPS